MVEFQLHTVAGILKFQLMNIFVMSKHDLSKEMNFFYHFFCLSFRYLVLLRFSMKRFLKCLKNSNATHIFKDRKNIIFHWISEIISQNFATLRPGLFKRCWCFLLMITQKITHNEMFGRRQIFFLVV